MINSVKKVIVKYNGTIVGYLAELSEGRIAFQYDDEWIKKGFSISPFSLPLKSEVFVNEKPLFSGLFGVFRDSLPDGWGELLMNRMLAKKGVNPDRVSPITKLSLVGDSGLGGLTYEPSQPFTNEENGVDLDELVLEVQKILMDGDENSDLDRVYRLGGSSGGARPKAHIKIDNEEWIVKFPCRIDPPDVGEREYSANRLAENCGINVSKYKLLPSKICSGYFGTKRFDRIGSKRVHMVSLSALLETTHRLPNLDYMHYFQVIQAICVNPKESLYEGFRRMCFNVLCFSKDDHGKNFAFLYDEDKGGYVLSPHYDITFTPDKYEHEMTVLGVGNPTEKELLALAKKFKLSLKECARIITEIKEAK
ncbi:MAG: type II toxin-antitoxin system HipA family toxin [Clostridia bacterium]|nr:type II toxin-antitoxin system HipA family toxin [Clostridia bacterium]